MEWIWLAVGLLLGSLAGWWWGRREVTPQLAQLQNELAAQTQRSSQLETDLHAQTEHGSDVERRLAAAEFAAADASTGLETKSADLVASRQEVAETRQALKALNHETQHHETVQAELAQKLRAAEAVAAEAQTRYDQVTEEFVSLRRLARQAESERDEVRADRDGTVGRLREAAANAEQQAAAAVGDRAELERRLSVAAARLEALEGCAETAAEAQAELGQLRNHLSDQRRRIASLDADLAALRSRPAGSESSASEISDDGGSSRPAPEVPAEVEPIAEVELDVAGSLDGENSDDSGNPIDDDGVEEHLEAENASSPSPPEDEVAPPAGVESNRVISHDTLASGEMRDELQSIRGIGPKFERMLNDRNVVTFKDVVDLGSDEDWESYLETFPGRIEREEWREQARALHEAKYLDTA